MARPLRIEYPGALYHVTSRGDETVESNPAIAQAAQEQVTETIADLDTRSTQ